jgi:hypothetical protein
MASAIDNFFSRYLGYIQSDFPNICIRLAKMNEAGRDKKVHEIIQIGPGLFW